METEIFGSCRVHRVEAADIGGPGGRLVVADEFADVSNSVALARYLLE